MSLNGHFAELALVENLLHNVCAKVSKGIKGRSSALRRLCQICVPCPPPSRGCAAVCTRTGSYHRHQPPANTLRGETRAKYSAIWEDFSDFEANCLIHHCDQKHNNLHTRLYVIWYAYAWNGLTRREERRALGLLWERFYIAAVHFSLILWKF